MGVLAAGQVVLLLYPFSDLSRNKHRPGIILAPAGRQDWIICQITSNPFNDLHALQIEDADFASGSLDHTSYVRPGKVFTAHVSLIRSQIGQLDPSSFHRYREAVIQIIRPS